jgi:hypothetical protein
MRLQLFLHTFFILNFVYSQTLNRGPYLNIVTPNSIVVKWRTNTAADSKVFYGTSVTSLTNLAVDPTIISNHEVKITGLTPATVYYYAIASSSSTLTTPSSTVFFKTSPLTGSVGNYKFWVVGDAGTGSSNQTNVKNGFLNYTSNSHIDGWLWLGDNAYEGGLDNEYQSNVFTNNAYANELKRIVVWPAAGNHDFNNYQINPFAASTFPYFDIFTLPAAAEAGGVASGTEKYYSYNYGNVHFIVLDSYSVGRNSTDPMAIWLTNDLASNTLPWVIAYWHHPPYTKGSHNSDNSTFLDGELPEIRQNIVPILENGGVDLVLNGHSHCYERSYLLDGHYGNSGSFNSSMKKDPTGGSYPASCPYQKQTTVSKSHKGAVYTVCGCSGKLSGTSSGWPHPVFYNYSNTIFGSMLLEVNDNRLDAKFIDGTATVKDQFTIVKNAGKKINLTTCANQPLTLTPSWPATVQWFPLGVTQNTVSITTMVPTIYYAYDALSCIKDTFVVSITPSALCGTLTALYQNELNNQVVVYPNVLNKSNTKIKINHMPDMLISEIHFYDVSGKKTSANTNEINTSTIEADTKNLNNGVYFMEILFNDSRKAFKKIIIND